MRKCEGKIALRRPSLKWEDDFKADLEEIGSEGLDWNPMGEIGFGGRLM
jgi:hypothetical protein